MRATSIVSTTLHPEQTNVRKSCCGLFDGSFLSGPLCSRTAGTCGGPECNHNRKRERFAALVTAMTPKRYVRRLGSHNPSLCNKSTARFFNIFNLQGIGDVPLTGAF